MLHAFLASAHFFVFRILEMPKSPAISDPIRSRFEIAAIRITAISVATFALLFSRFHVLKVIALPWNNCGPPAVSGGKGAVRSGLCANTQTHSC